MSAREVEIVFLMADLSGFAALVPDSADGASARDYVLRAKERLKGSPEAGRGRRSP